MLHVHLLSGTENSSPLHCHEKVTPVDPLTLQVTFWLVENGFRVLIAACDTFRAGAVEQLRTHTRKLNALHPPQDHNGVQMVQLYEKGYGKDAAGIAMEAINFGKPIQGLFYYFVQQIDQTTYMHHVFN